MTSSAMPLAQFRALVEADPTLQEKLSEPDDPTLFIALAVATAQHHGIDLDADELATAIHLPRQTSTDGNARLPPRGWLPVRARWQDQELNIDWAYAGSQQLREPFFDESVARFTAKPFNRLLRYTTPISALAGWVQQHPGVKPTGFIFHMSRCGSTLVSQMLAAIPDNVVASEADPIDTVVRAKATLPALGEEQHAEWLRSMIGALGQPRTGAERHFFVKLDSWHSLALPLFRRAFPDVPWIFLYRDPVEVLVSQLRQRGSHMVPGLIGGNVFGLDAAAATLTPEQFCARVLDRICDSALRNYTSGNGLLVNYRQLPATLWTDVLPHFSVSTSEADRAAMADAARRDAKRPDLPFSDDTTAKQALATDRIQSAAASLGGLYTRLEALRRLEA